MKLYIYRLLDDGTTAAYDEAVAVSCVQGILNREEPLLYVASPRKMAPDWWLDRFRSKGEWLENRELAAVAGWPALRALAGERLKGAAIWDPQVPATLNVATTFAGLEDAVVMSPECYERWGQDLPVMLDLRGKFDGSGTGSAKNDAYRWAIAQYMDRCCGHLLCLFEDAYDVREQGNTRYAVTRDRAVRERAFVYDLSPWADEVPLDDPDAPLGCDYETYGQLLEAVLRRAGGQRMTEVCGFFNFEKYSNVGGKSAGNKHLPVPTEWQTVYLISPYNCYQNTVAHDCFNVSFHQHFDLHQLHQEKPAALPQLENKLYLCAFHADYDSATPLYDFMPPIWDDPERGSIKLTWGINPNLMESYPDIFEYLYRTAAPGDCFTGDASAAGYFNPSRVRAEHWEAVERIAEFSPDGMGTIVIDFHSKVNPDAEQEPVPAQPHLVQGMPVIKMINDACNSMDPQLHADVLKRECKPGEPQFALVRNIWKKPAEFKRMYDETIAMMPEYDVEIVNGYEFFGLLKAYLSR